MDRSVRALVCLALGVALAGCGGRANAPIDADRARAADWRKVAMPADRTRLRGWRETWMEALPEARKADAAGIAKEGMLFAPDRALAGAMPPAGDYSCRVFKLGAQGTAMRGFTSYPFFACRVDDEGDVKSLYKTTGSQRPVGLLFPDGANRAVFLGTLLLGDETSALEYGRDANRDLAGIVERIGERRWRLVLPRPRFESKLDVIELVPAG